MKICSCTGYSEGRKLGTCTCGHTYGEHSAAGKTCLARTGNAPKHAGACSRRDPHECADDVDYCERCGGYRPDSHRCDTGSSPGGDTG